MTFLRIEVQMLVRHVIITSVAIITVVNAVCY